MRKPLHRRNSILASAIATTLALSAGAPTVSWAQTADATLRGKAAANAEVTAKNVATGVVRRTKAGADGAYTLVGLPPGRTTRQKPLPRSKLQTCITEALLGLRHLTRRNIVCIKGMPAISRGFQIIPFTWW